MPRAWRRLPLALVLAAALGQVSCFHDATDCPTCPAANSARLEVAVPQLGTLDSVHVQVDGGAQVSVRRNRRHVFENLSAGTHEVTLVRWLEGSVISRTAVLRIRLVRGETRSIVFHNDFPLVAWVSPAALPRAAAARRARMG